MENISTYYDIKRIKVENCVRLLNRLDVFRLLRYIEDNMENNQNQKGKDGLH